MFQPDKDNPNQDNLNQGLSSDISRNNSDQNLDRIDANISPLSVAIRKKQLEGIFTKLIIFGLTLGTVLGLGAYYLLHKFGLTKKPYQLEQERIEREQQPATPVEKIDHLLLPDAQGDRFKI
ncbi:MAG: hypothetical protein AAF652_09715 [Cyanobacteria bacterium P01_C01_bin.72]